MTLPAYLQLNNLGKLSALARLGDARIMNGASSFSIVRISEGAKAHAAYAIPAVKLYVTADALASKSILAKIDSYEMGTARYLPYIDDVLISRGSVTNSVGRERITTLADFVAGKIDTLVISADSLIQRLPAPRLVEEFSTLLEKEQIISPQEVANRLVRAGYHRCDGVGEIGDFCLRGDILDVYSVDGKNYRIDFFDELIECIKTINTEEMVSTGEVARLIIPPAQEILLDEQGVTSAVNALKKYPNCQRACEFAAESLQVGANSEAVWVLPFAEECTASIFDYLDYVEKTRGKAVLIFDEPKSINEKLGVVRREFEGRIKSFLESGEVLAEHKKAVYSQNEFNRSILLRRKVSFSSLALSNPIFEAQSVLQPKCIPVNKYYLDSESIYGDLTGYRQNGYRVMLACGSEERARAILRNLIDGGVYAVYSPDGNGGGEDGAGVLVTPLKISTGFCYADLKVVVIGMSECVGKQRESVFIQRKTQFTAPKQGDYVVHRVHGVGVCEGTTMLKTGEFEKEYIVLRYRDGDTLYVATDQTDNLQKFVGEEHPRLNKIGGKEFEREKEKVRSSVRKLAVNLLDIYARRENQLGYKYSADTVWQKEFEDDFPYDETEDQLRAIDDIKRDMENGKIMDRLLVGDVGFGKTEVALRAIFKTVVDSKQAVLLAPTTILARQHYETLKPRLQKFGIECALLSRLQTKSENDEVIRRLADGTLHIVVSTHKVLGDKVAFHDLGLLVLDEEQRFGVNHKEKIKEKNPLVNVLTLSATPIPRTLNMALSGIRDISMLETPPKGRLPVQTYVTPYSNTLVKDAIIRECARGGQTLILLNDIDGLDLVAADLHDLVGQDVKIITAHGQMNPVELEKRMSAFYDKRYDVLIATTIIENGIDLPDANTLIVVNSGNFGLSQLYQLRGRVGRRGALAHAYFTIPENGALGDTAQKRLQAMLDNTEIGSGFKIAMSDLSIRGAGNLLGAEQHGHIEKVGYEMYVELLNQTIEELRTGVPHKDAREVEMKVDAPAYVNNSYVGARDKVRIYKRIAGVSSFADRDVLVKELNDVFGEVDRPLNNLINIALLKNLAKHFDVSKITINKAGAGIAFGDSEIFKNEDLMRAVATYADKAVLTSTIPPSIIFDVKDLSPEQKIEKLLGFFAVTSVS